MAKNTPIEWCDSVLNLQMKRDNDFIAKELFAKQGKLIIQSRYPMEIGKILGTGGPGQPNTILLVVVAEADKIEYLRQHQTDIGQSDNLYTPGWEYFYRVEAAD